MHGILNKLVSVSVVVNKITKVFSKPKKVKENIIDNRNQIQDINYRDGNTYYDDEEDWEEYVDTMNNIFGDNFLH